MRTKFLLITIVLFVSSLFFFSCGADPMDLVGTWELTDGEEPGYARTETIVFSQGDEGNTFTWIRISASVVEYDVAGTWAVISDKEGGDVSYRVKFSFKDANGQDSNKSLFYAPVPGGMLFSDGSAKDVYQTKITEESSSESEE